MKGRRDGIFARRIGRTGISGISAAAGESVTPHRRWNNTGEVLRPVSRNLAVRHIRFAIVAPAIVLAGNLVAQEQVYHQPAENAAPAAVESAGATKSWKERWHEFSADFQLNCARSNAWPEPFQQPDRELVRSPFRTMADNGWREQNTFTDFLFADERSELNLAGREKLRSILTQLPPHRRQIFVVEAERPEETAARVASVQQQIAELAPHQTVPVFLTQLQPRYGDGRYQNGVNRSYDSTLPEPRLPIPTYPSIFAGGAATR
jgi:hypothetical protein